MKFERVAQIGSSAAFVLLAAGVLFLGAGHAAADEFTDNLLCKVQEVGSTSPMYFPVLVEGDCTRQGGQVTDWCLNVPGDQGPTEYPACVMPSGSASTTATLIVIKEVVGGTKAPIDFSLFVNGLPITTGVPTTTAPGTYTITETDDVDYTPTFSAECPGGVVTLTASSTVECTMTNTFVGTFTATSTASTTPTTPATGGTSPTGGGGSNVVGGGSAGGGSIPAGQVLGTATGPGAACPQYLTGFIKPGEANDRDQVYRLQALLKTFEGANVELTGVYDDASIAAVSAFQEKYAAEILAPWDISQSTGYVYLTTRKKINEVFCANGREFPLSAAEERIIESSKVASAPAAAPEVKSATTARDQAPSATSTTSTEEGDEPVVDTPGRSFGDFFQRLFDRFR